MLSHLSRKTLHIFTSPQLLLDSVDKWLIDSKMLFLVLWKLVLLNRAQGKAFRSFLVFCAQKFEHFVPPFYVANLDARV